VALVRCWLGRGVTERTPGGAGTRTATLTLTDNASPTTQSVTLTGVGGQAAATLSPNSLDFGTVAVGGSGAQKAVKIKSTGTMTLNVTGYSIGGADPSDFDLIGGSCPAVPFNLAPGATCTIDMYFAPTAAGSRSATLSISDNAGTSPQQVLVGGNGSPSADVAVFITPSAATVRSGSTVTYSVVVDNNGPSAAADVTVSDALPSNAGFVSSSGASCTTPPAGYTGTVVWSLGTMAASSSQTLTFTVTLTGKAKTKVLDKVTVKASTHDPVTSNNTASTTAKLS
jgi:uncharacterized repeat protein (TIGR01451 family)